MLTRKLVLTGCVLFAATAATIVLAQTSATPSPSATAAGPKLDSLSWITGHWRHEGNNRSVEEIWTDAAGGTMFGVSRTIAGDKVREFEFIRITTDKDGIVYLAQPGGRAPATPFHLKESSEDRVLFANPKHDFPKTVEYRLDGDALTATIGGDGGKTMSWTFKRVAGK